MIDSVYAVDTQSIVILRLLLESGANPNARSTFSTKAVPVDYIVSDESDVAEAIARLLLAQPSRTLLLERPQIDLE